MGHRFKVTFEELTQNEGPDPVNPVGGVLQ